VGRNFAAGMTGGMAYVLDASGSMLAEAAGERSVSLRPGLETDDTWVRAWLAEHHERTGSALAAALLRDWRATRARFSTIAPHGENAPVRPPVLPEPGEPVEVRVPLVYARWAAVHTVPPSETSPL
jgi:glutamate synthase domain-containing protein 3